MDLFNTLRKGVIENEKVGKFHVVQHGIFAGVSFPQLLLIGDFSYFAGKNFCGA